MGLAALLLRCLLLTALERPDSHGPASGASLLLRLGLCGRACGAFACNNREPQGRSEW